LTLFSLSLAHMPCPVNGATTVESFEAIPDYPTPVDAFGSMLSGVTLSSQNQWIASYVNATDFLNISGRCIANYGVAPLSIFFASPSQDIALDLGSGHRFQSQTASVQGYLDGQLVYSQNFVTQPTPSGVEEVRAYTFGLVDHVIVRSSSGGFALMVDNLSFTPVPEPGTVSLMIAAGLLALLGGARRKK